MGDGLPEKTASASHTYAKPGKYRVSVVVWDAQHNATHVERTVVIR